MVSLIANEIQAAPEDVAKNLVAGWQPYGSAPDVGSSIPRSRRRSEYTGAHVCGASRMGRARGS